ncbi:MAG: HD-GYP domain-containing protein (c-di-GMP phosphodiesterase class II) [Psychromonas sp.]|jgi:HD-GYP domain-containing protein (c-di-GMP phosphodiesterase class II)|uniref:HD-GYP domain-containing protein n=1 Tax=Psychromonas sp. TaxID=1884585 RepID=UPI0039E67398
MDKKQLDYQHEALTCALKHRDLYTQLHSQRVIALSEALGTACQLSATEIDILKISASLHDIGKIGTPDQILLKAGKLDPEQWLIMKSHSQMGEDIIKKLDIKNTQTIANIVRHHHEHYDGQGYPDQLAGEQIPLLSRIISVADSYDAITESRPYHQAKTHQRAMQILHGEKGTKLDPKLVELFTLLIETSQYKAQ